LAIEEKNRVEIFL